MATAAQFAANQANAQHATGPVSPQGKATSARNRLTHGFRSATVLLPGDDPAEYDVLLAELTEHLGPEDLTETRLTREMADAEWRLRRVRCHMESAFSRHIATLALQNPSLDPLDLQSLAVETLHQTGCSHSTWLRYETKFERQYDRAYNTWTRYQQRRTRNARQEFDCAIVQALAVPPPTATETVPTELGSNVQTVHNPFCSCGSGENCQTCRGQNAPPVPHSSALKAAA